MGRQILSRRGVTHPRVRAYVKNHNLGLEVPYIVTAVRIAPIAPTLSYWSTTVMGQTTSFISSLKSRANRREDAKEKKATMDTYWVRRVNKLGTYGRWAFAEFTDIYEYRVRHSKPRLRVNSIRRLRQCPFRSDSPVSCPTEHRSTSIRNEYEGKRLKLFKNN